jgi:hypothetical protein
MAICDSNGYNVPAVNETDLSTITSPLIIDWLRILPQAEQCIKSASSPCGNNDSALICIDDETMASLSEFVRLPKLFNLEIFILFGFMWFAEILNNELFVLDRLIEIIFGKHALFHRVER